MRHTLTTVVIAALFAAAAQAQTESTKAPVPHQQVISTNPLGAIVKWFNVEYERKITPATTWGVAASTFDEMDYRSASLLVRWYPQQAALDGFYLGARTGVYHFENYRRRATVLPGAGLEIGHAWLFGPKRNASVNLGFGLTRVLGKGSDEYGAPSVLPNVRLVNIGIAF